MNLYLTSVCEEIKSIPALKDLINGRTKLIVLPFAHDFEWLSCAEDVYKKYSRCPKETESIFYKTVKPFVDLGIDYRNIVVINHFADPVSLIKHKLLAPNTIVYLPGGRPENIMKILKALTLIETIKKCETVVGESAGSMIWSKNYFVYPDQDYPKYRRFKGLGLIKNCVIIPHYDLKIRERILACARKFSWIYKDKIYMIKDNGWVMYNTLLERVVQSKNAFIYSKKNKKR